MLGTSVRFAASSAPIMPFLRASKTILRTAESRTLTVEGESASMVARYSIRRARLRGPAGREGEQVVNGLRVVPARVRGSDQVRNHATEDGLGLGKGCRIGRRRVVGPLGGGAPGNEKIDPFSFSVNE